MLVGKVRGKLSPYGSDGYDRDGYNRNGYNSWGYDCDEPKQE